MGTGGVNNCHNSLQGPQCTQWDGRSCWYQCVRGSCKYATVCACVQCHVYTGCPLHRLAATHRPGEVAEVSTWVKQRILDAWRRHGEQSNLLQASPPRYVLSGQHAQGIPVPGLLRHRHSAENTTHAGWMELSTVLERSVLERVWGQSVWGCDNPFTP